jgi:uncharacterized repeat protein (TIGR01451 family)
MPRQTAVYAAVLLLTRIFSPAFASSVTTQKAEILTSPRSASSPTRLVFGYVTDQAGFDTEITISNTSQDTLGSAPQAGTCALNFYGGSNQSTATTSSIAAGKQLVFKLSQGGGGVAAMPSFQGYLIATCGFPMARGSANVLGATYLAFSQDAQVITTPRSSSSPTRLLFPYVTNQAGFDTGIIISNTSSDPFGTTATSGSCTVSFYGGTTAAPNVPPASVTTATIPGGAQWVTIASTIAPTFQGYVIATCNFSNAVGSAFVADDGARNIAMSETAEVLTLPRSTTARPLLFSSVSNQNGSDTGIVIANTSSDPFSTAAASGTCALNFYGANPPAPVTTPTIYAGTVYATLASTIAPGFRGYAVAVCTFPHSRGWAFTGPLGLRTDGDSETPEIVTTPRSVTPAPLLFTAVTNWNNYDTAITVSNTSQDPLGTAQASGACTLTYFGDMAAGGSVPSPQTSTIIQPGSQLSFSLTQGNAAQGIAATPGFRGYVIADCTFPLARGMATVALVPVITVTKSHTGNFAQGQNGATYTVTASNASGASSTSGTVTVTETAPAGMTLVSMAGTGWTCPGTAANNCTRSDALVGGASYPAIAVTVNVAAYATSPLVNQVSVSGGGAATANTSDSTVIATAAIQELFPDSAVAGGAGFSIYVIGSGFQSGATISWNNQQLATSSSGYTQFGSLPVLTATIPPALIATAGSASVTVSNPGQVASNAYTFRILAAAAPPVLTSAKVGYGWDINGIYTFGDVETVGTGLQPGATLTWNGTSLGVIGSNGPVQTIVPLALLQTPGLVSITATNPGAAPSSAIVWTVPSLRTLTSISQASVATGSGGFTVTVNGSGFVSGDSVTLAPGSSIFLATQFVSSNQLQATVPGSAIASARTLYVGVSNTAASGAFPSANQLPLVVGAFSDLSILKSHTGNFAQGQNGATYTVTASNASGTNSTSGTVTVTETVPTGMTLVSMAGTGWTCPGTAANNCTRSDALAAGANYPAITVTVNVAANAGSPLVNSVSVSGGGAATATATDSTVIAVPTSQGLRFVPITPCRIADTRNAAGPFGGPSITGGTSRDFTIPNSACSIPATAQAYSLNVAVVVPTGGTLGYLTLYPAGQSRPLASTLNSLDGRIKSNAAIVPAGTNGAVSVFASDTTHVILDINGYFVPASDPTGLAFYPITPCRIGDTRTATAPLGGPALVGGQSRTFPILASTCNLPATAQAYSLNFAAVPGGSSLGYLTAWPTGQSRPVAASLNALTGAVTANAAIVPAGTNGSIDVFASNNTNLVIDINGYFAPMGTGGLSLYGVTPCRVLDTRQPSGSAPITSLDVAVSASACGIPATAQADVISVTVVPQGTPAYLGYLTLWPQGQTRPVVSTLNALDGAITSNLAIVPTTNGSISAFASNLAHVILDISGYFAP